MAFRSRHLQSFVQEIQYKNRNPRSVRALELLEDLATNPVLELKSGAEVFRARLVNDLKLIHKEAGFFGFGAKESFVPPPEATEKYFLPFSTVHFLYVPATGCWNLVGLVEFPVMETSTPSWIIIATPSLTSSAPKQRTFDFSPDEKGCSPIIFSVPV